MIKTMAEATMMKAWSPDWYHWFKFSVTVDLSRVSHLRLTSERRCCGVLDARAEDLPESPPVGVVPLNWVGGPVHEYDMATDVPGGCVCGDGQDRQPEEGSRW